MSQSLTLNLHFGYLSLFSDSNPNLIYSCWHSGNSSAWSLRITTVSVCHIYSAWPCLRVSLLCPITLTTRITLKALNWTKLHAKLQTPNIKLQTPKHNPELKCDTLWPWPLHLDFPSAPICFLLSYCSCCSHLHICSMTPVPLALLSCTCSILNVSCYDAFVSSHVLSCLKL